MNAQWIRYLSYILFCLFFQTAQAAEGKTEVLWLGQSAFRITSPSGKVIVIDPFLTQNPKTPERYKKLSSLGHIDVILVTHAHSDHLGDAPDLVTGQHIPFIAPPGLSQSLVVLGAIPEDRVVPMDKSGSVMPFGSGIRITMVHAEHSSVLSWTNPTTHDKSTYPGGEPVGFIIEMENGFKIYHMGDTGLFSDMKWINDYYHPDLVLMPIGGRFTMDPSDAAFALRYWLHPKFLIPMHYGTFPLLTGTPEELIKAMGGQADKPLVKVLKPGEMATF